MHVCLCCFHAKSGCLATNDSEGVLVWELKLRTEWQRRFGGVAWAKLSGKEAKHTAEVGITPNLCNVLQPCLLCLLPWARFCSQERGASWVGAFTGKQMAGSEQCQNSLTPWSCVFLGLIWIATRRVVPPAAYLLIQNYTGSKGETFLYR